MNEWQEASIDKIIRVDTVYIQRGQCITIALNTGTRSNPVQQQVELRVHKSGKPEVFCHLSKVSVRDFDDWTNDMEPEK